MTKGKAPAGGAWRRTGDRLERVAATRPPEPFGQAETPPAEQAKRPARSAPGKEERQDG